MNIVTKSGSNDWHGDAFEFVRNGDVNALNYFAVAQDSLKRNQFGGTFGGHIIRDKLFFFGGIQETIVRQDPSGSSAFIPTTAALNGDFSSLDGAGCQSSGTARAIKDPQTGTPLGPTDSHQSNSFRSGGRRLHEVSTGFFGKCLRSNSLRRSGDLRRTAIRHSRRLGDERKAASSTAAICSDNYDSARPLESEQLSVHHDARRESNAADLCAGSYLRNQSPHVELVPLYVRPQILCTIPEYQRNRSSQTRGLAYIHSAAGAGQPANVDQQ